jgi:hypothetical protein
MRDVWLSRLFSAIVEQDLKDVTLYCESMVFSELNENEYDNNLLSNCAASSGGVRVGSGLRGVTGGICTLATEPPYFYSLRATLTKT